MKKSISSTIFVCQNCGYESPKWVGQCPSCSQWNTFEETLRERSQGGASRTRASRQAGSAQNGGAHTVALSHVSSRIGVGERIATGMDEFDRVLGGGIVPGSVLLVGGEPGIGKSTLLTQLVINILTKGSETDHILYVCGEESPEQISLRIDRITSGISGKNSGVSSFVSAKKSVVKKTVDQIWKDRLLFLSSTDTDRCVSTIYDQKPSLVIVDSIQSMQTSDLSGTAGSIGQLKESTFRLTQVAKEIGVPIFLVGHVTKEGDIAGPKVLEHIVDAVLELSGERTGFLRVLRSIKNRFGATDEVGMFLIEERGLRELSNPSDELLSDVRNGVAGSAVAAVLEGTRVLLLEVQALTVKSQLAMPRRVGRGVALSRIQVICAVLQKHCHLSLGEMDVFVNVAGGLTINEPALDLAIAMAIASSVKGKPLLSDTAYAGEIGLLGEIRAVSMEERRAKEAKRMGFPVVVGRKVQRLLSRLVSGL